MTLGIIQARLGSFRFPRKALADLQGKPLIQHVVDRALRIRGLDHLVLACPDHDAVAFGEALTDSIRVLGFSCPDDDVLQRFALTLDRYPNSDTVMRLTGDCPMLEPRICEQVLGVYQMKRRAEGVEYVWNCAPGYVDGEDCEVFSASALKWAARSAAPFDREHVTPWIRRNCKTFTLMPESDRGYLKTSVDTIEDLERVRRLVA